MKVDKPRSSYILGMGCQCPKCKQDIARRGMHAATFQPGILCALCGWISLTELIDSRDTSS